MRNLRMKAFLRVVPLLLVLIGSASGGAFLLNDRAIRPAPPAPALPPAGGKFTDPTYHTEILRVTDRRDGDHAAHAYSLWTPFNAASTRFLIETVTVENFLSNNWRRAMAAQTCLQRVWAPPASPSLTSI